MIEFPGPLQLHWFEVWVMRIGFAVLLYRRLSFRTRFTSQPHPVGLARFVDLTFLAREGVPERLRAVSLVALLLYVLGVALPLVTAWLCLFIVAKKTLENSQGGIGHAIQPVALIVLSQSVAYGVHAGDTAVWRGFDFRNAAPAHDLAVYWSQQALVAVYFTSAISKLVRSRLKWVAQSPRIRLQLVKTAEQAHYSALDDDVRSRNLKLANKLQERPRMLRALLAGGLVVEIAIPLAFVSRLGLILGGVSLLGFHQVNGRLMRLPFRANQWLVLLYLVNPAYVLALAVQ